LSLFLWRYILGLRAYEAPNFVALDSLGANVTDVGIMVFGARLTKIDQELCDRVYRNIGQSARGAKAIPFNE
jgi:hypothetical protein